MGKVSVCTWAACALYKNTIFQSHHQSIIKKHRLGMVAHACNPSYLEGRDPSQQISWVWWQCLLSQLFRRDRKEDFCPRQKHKTLSKKIAKIKMAGGLAQVIEHLPS
jgi:hypothetical protein